MEVRMFFNELLLLDQLYDMKFRTARARGLMINRINLEKLTIKMEIS
jgi:hypothetical protein